MPRGGYRNGKAGKAYPNRSDLTAQPIKTAPSQQYGDATAQAAAQRAIPLPGPPAPMPGAQPFDRPSDRPGEPLTAGMVQGPGAGPSMAQPSVDPVAETLRAAYAAVGSPQIAALLEDVLNNQSGP